MERRAEVGVSAGMTRMMLLLGLLALAACAAETGPPGQPSPDGNVNPVTGTRSKGGT